MIQTINLTNQNVNVNYKKGNNAEISLTTDKDTLIITLDTFDLVQSLESLLDVFECDRVEDLKGEIEGQNKIIEELKKDKEYLEAEREDIENKMLKYEAENEDLKDRLEQYEENFQAQLEKTQLSCGLF